MSAPCPPGGPEWRCLLRRRGLRAVRVWSRAGEPEFAGIADLIGKELPAGFARVPSAATSVVLRGPSPQGGTLYVKRYLMRDATDRLKHLLFRASRARRALRGAELFRSRGFDAPRPVLLLEDSILGVTVRSALVSDDAGAGFRAAAWWTTEGWPSLGRGDRRALIRALAAHVAAMHGEGLVHGDMRGGNLLARRAAEGWSFCWLDTEGNRRFRRVPLRWRSKNLVQLNMLRGGIGPRDRAAFWRAYRVAAGLPAAQSRQLRRLVAARTAVRWAKRGWTALAPAPHPP